MDKEKPIILKVDPNTGHLTSEWWDEFTGDILCFLCADCPGWRSNQKPVDCITGNKFCG